MYRFSNYTLDRSEYSYLPPTMYSHSHWSRLYASSMTSIKSRGSRDKRATVTCMQPFPCPRARWQHVMVYCAAFGCNASSAKSTDNKHSHWFRFPLTDGRLLRKWLDHMRRADFTPTKHSRLCSDHFERSCFDRDPEIMAVFGYKGAHITLLKDAVPTLFPITDELLTPSTQRTCASRTGTATTVSMTMTGTSVSAGETDSGPSLTLSASSLASDSTTSTTTTTETEYFAGDEFTRSRFRKRRKVEVCNYWRVAVFVHCPWPCVYLTKLNWIIYGWIACVVSKHVKYIKFDAFRPRDYQLDLYAGALTIVAYNARFCEILNCNLYGAGLFIDVLNYILY